MTTGRSGGEEGLKRQGKKSTSTVYDDRESMEKKAHRAGMVDGDEVKMDRGAHVSALVDRGAWTGWEG